LLSAGKLFELLISERGIRYTEDGKKQHDLFVFNSFLRMKLD
jgi:hypothetical protein